MPQHAEMNPEAVETIVQAWTDGTLAIFVGEGGRMLCLDRTQGWEESNDTALEIPAEWISPVLDAVNAAGPVDEHPGPGGVIYVPKA